MAIAKNGVFLPHRTIMKIISKVRKDTLDELKEYLKSLVPLMTKDVSYKATDRYRMWLFNHCDLRNGQISPAYYNERLFRFCQRVYPGCNIGLLSFGGQVNGIKSSGLIDDHRDHSYSQPIARTVNIGEAIFRVNGVDHELNDGQIIEFNCKQIHSLTEIRSELRFGLNLWKLNEQKGYRSARDLKY
ncbi:hypothetical protein [Dolichospermum circinale]|uniref:hypothetical protein n=2 Tax=Dolichospermum circinale TaxID=109265 RepID=UPI00040541A9|nr:hypothetical protein [Dolichospermum circinale]MDB9456914.1 hypothetical protein [Dolichospermum circinale CS-545/17]